MITFREYLIQLSEQDNEKLAAGVLLRAKDSGRYMVAYRSDKCDNPHTWGPIGGSAQDNEGSIEAAIREVKEEAGISLEDHQLEPLSVFKKKNFHYHTFLGHVDKESDIDNNLKLNDENDKVTWFHHHTPPTPLHPGFEETINIPSVKKRLAK